MSLPLKKNEFRKSHFNKVNVEHHTFGENGGRRDLILSKNPKEAKIADAYLIDSILRKLEVKF